MGSIWLINRCQGWTNRACLWLHTRHLGIDVIYVTLAWLLCDEKGMLLVELQGLLAYMQHMTAFQIKVGWKWKWSEKCRKSEISLIWFISTTNNVKSCKTFNKTSQTANLTEGRLLQKKRENMGIFSQVWEPRVCEKKKNYGLFCILGP